MTTKPTDAALTVKHFASGQFALLNEDGQEVASIVSYHKRGESLAFKFAAAPDLLEACQQYNSAADAYREGRITSGALAEHLLNIDCITGYPAIAKATQTP